MKKKLWTAALCVSLMAGLAGCSGFSAGKGDKGLSAGSDTIRIGVRVDIERWAYYDKVSQVYSGAEVDYARALGKELGYDKVELVSVTPETLKSSIENDQVDCLVSKCTIMDTSKEKYEFSPAYYEDHGSVMVEKSTGIKKFEGLKGQKIAYLNGSDVKEKLQKKMIALAIMTEEDAGGTEFVGYDNYEEMSQALETGDVVGFAADGCILRAWQDDQREILEEAYQDKEYGVAVIKDTPLSDEIERAVKDLSEAGVMDKIVERWY